MNNAYYTIIGMDVGDRKTQVCVMARAAGAPKVVMETAIPTTREGLAKFLATQDRNAELRRQFPQLKFFIWVNPAIILL